MAEGERNAWGVWERDKARMWRGKSRTTPTRVSLADAPARRSGMEALTGRYTLLAPKRTGAQPIFQLYKADTPCYKR